MIIDLPRFVAAERPYWEELQTALHRLDNEPELRLPLPDVERLHYLYERASSDLSRLDTFATAPELRGFLASVVAGAYARIHETRQPARPNWKRLFHAFPQAFRRHTAAFHLALAVTLLGCLFGWLALRADPRNKAILLPFDNLLGSPSERVHQEESARADRLQGVKATFAAELMTHNAQVAVVAMALGLTFGTGTLILLFYNGVILGAVAADYIAGGQAVFLAGWLLPHGSIEIPAILIGGQAGFVLAGALIGWGDRTPRAQRLREVAPDLVALVLGASALLVWAGMVESFISQYHQPVIPYALKISFGCCELAALGCLLAWAGRK